MLFRSRVMSLLLNMLSRLVTTFLPRSKRLLISWLQLPSAVILEPQRIKSDTVSTVAHLFTSYVLMKVIPESEKSLIKSDLEAGSLEAGKPRAFRSPIVLRKYKLDFRGN